MNCIFTDAKREKAKNTFKKCISPPRSNVSDPAGCSFSRVFFFYLELWAMRKTRFSLIQSLSLWHDPIFCWTFGIFCFRFVYNNATITEKLNCICTLNRTFAELYWCVRVWVCCLHTKMHSKSPKSFTVFFFILQIRFFPGFVRIRGDHTRTQLTSIVLQISARKFVYFFHSIVSISFPLGRTLPFLELSHSHSFIQLADALHKCALKFDVAAAWILIHVRCHYFFCFS